MYLATASSKTAPDKLEIAVPEYEFEGSLNVDEDDPTEGDTARETSIQPQTICRLLKLMTLFSTPKFPRKMM